MNPQRLRQDLEGFEGHRQYPYDDKTGKRVYAPAGHLSVGIGHNMDEPLPAQIVTALYEYDVNVATRAASSFLPPGVWTALDSVRQEVLVQMAFQLGEPVLRGFIKFRQAVIQGKHEEASQHMLNSKWHEQVPARVAKLAARWRSGNHEGES